VAERPGAAGWRKQRLRHASQLRDICRAGPYPVLRAGGFPRSERNLGSMLDKLPDKPANATPYRAADG
jgi:hypothetical protein